MKRSGYICAWPSCERAAKYSRLNANGQAVLVCHRHAGLRMAVPLSRPRSTHESATGPIIEGARGFDREGGTE